MHDSIQVYTVRKVDSMTVRQYTGKYYETGGQRDCVTVQV